MSLFKSALIALKKDIQTSLIHKPYSPRRRCSLYTPGKVDKILPVLTKTDAAATIIIGRVVPKKDAAIFLKYPVLTGSDYDST